MTIDREQVRYRPAAPVESEDARYKGFSQGSTVLPVGYQHEKGARALTCAIVHERNIPLVMRDGITLYADVFRPATDAKLPALINWSPYGKAGTGYNMLGRFPNRFGIPKSALSGLESWEGNDPGYWCAHGYAIVQIDARGAFDSEGDIFAHGSGEGRDGHDAVELVAGLPWCTGKVGLAGNSWLASAQWFIAAERPPSLVAIAPWEGSTDVHRQVFSRGGVPRVDFVAGIAETIYGRGQIEDVFAMLEERPFFDEYWADKVPSLESIEVPSYVVASYSNPVHAGGTVAGWERLQADSWLRIHNSMEWPDFYEPAHVDDLRRFFDHYLLAMDNGWDDTPRVRLAVLDPGRTDTVARPADSFPPSSVQNIDLFLDSTTGQLSASEVENEGQISYELGAPTQLADFTYTFTDVTEVIGWPSLTLWVSTEGCSDADLHVYLQKLDGHGRQLWHQVADLGLPFGRKWMPLLHRAGFKPMALAFYGGSDGVLRLSRRGLDPNATTTRPVLELKDEKPLAPGELVEVTVPLWPISMRWHAGEQLRLRISGKSLLPRIGPAPEEPPGRGGSKLFIHTGGDHRGKVTLPINRPAGQTADARLTRRSS